MDINCNGFLSLAEVDKGIKDLINLPVLFELKPVVMRAFRAAKTSTKSKSKLDDNLVSEAEYRYLLKYLQHYYEYWVAFDRTEENHYKRISK